MFAINVATPLVPIVVNEPKSPLVPAVPLDPLAKSEEDERFNEMKVKVMMREAAMKAGNEELANSPVLKPMEGEPEDMEQLLMEQQFGYKHVMAMEAECAIALTMYKNKFDEKRKRTIENLFDFGIGGYTEYIDENGAVNVREVNPENLVLSYCAKK